MITITISGEQGEGKTRLMFLICRLLRALDYVVSTEHEITNTTPSIHIRTEQVKAKV